MLLRRSKCLRQKGGHKKISLFNKVSFVRHGCLTLKLENVPLSDKVQLGPGLAIVLVSYLCHWCSLFIAALRHREQHDIWVCLSSARSLTVISCLLIGWRNLVKPPPPPADCVTMVLLWRMSETLISATLIISSYFVTSQRGTLAHCFPSSSLLLSFPPVPVCNQYSV